MAIERDEDELLDEAYELKVKNHDTSDWTQDDHDFAKLAGEYYDKKEAEKEDPDGKK